MTASYDKLGLQFLYPENWKLTDSGDDQLPHEITIESPDGGAMWSVHVYPDDADRDALIGETLKTLGETYPDLEVSTAKASLPATEGVATEALFYCLDFLVRTRLQVLRTDEHKVLAWYQAEDRDFEKLEIVFDAITTSLLQDM
jgi:hypothetical protein